MYKSFAIPSLAIKVIFIILIPVLLPFPLIMSSDDKLISIICLILMELLFSLILLIRYGKSLAIVTINEKGIKNRRVSLLWEEIGAAMALEIESQKYHSSGIIWKAIDVACFSVDREEGTFFSVNKDRVVLIRMDKKTYKILNMYARGKSETIDRFLDSIDWYKCVE